MQLSVSHYIGHAHSEGLHNAQQERWQPTITVVIAVAITVALCYGNDKSLAHNCSSSAAGSAMQ
eukprot:3878-Heterococcus_DN1.PRE.1